MAAEDAGSERAARRAVGRYTRGMRWILLSFLGLGCSGGSPLQSVEPVGAVEPVEPVEPVESRKPPGLAGGPEQSTGDAITSTIVSSNEGWGAVFWRDSVAYQLGGGGEAVGPRGRTTLRVREPRSTFCGGVAVDDAPPHAVLVLPEGRVGDVPQKPSVIPASTVEAAAWRMDELLPGRDRFTPVNPDAAPALQRGVEVGSVVKVRRYGGPPVVLVGGRRGSVGGLVLVDHTASTVQAQLLVDGFESTPRVLPPTDLDGDGSLETALFTDRRVVLARLQLTPASAALTGLESWVCEDAADVP